MTSAALVLSGLIVTTILAPVATAAVSPIAPRSASDITADPLPTVQIDGVVWDQQIVGDTVYAVGDFDTARPAGSAPGVNTTARSNILAYNLKTGVLITSFAASLNAQGRTVTASPDGSRIYVGGNFTSANGVNRYRIAAYSTSTGALITTFAPSLNYTVTAIVATNTTVYVGGSFTAASNQTRTRLAAFNASNGAITTWAPTADAQVNAMVLTPDGSKLVIGGSFQNVNGSPAYGMAALSPTTGTSLPWNTTQLIRNAGQTAAILSLTTSGTSVYGTGYHYGPGGNLEGIFKANQTNGDVEWVEDCHGDTYDATVANGTVYSVSHAHYCGNVGGFPQTEPWTTNQRHALAFTDTVTGELRHDPYGYFDFYGTPSPSMKAWFPDWTVGSFTGQTQAGWTTTSNSQYVIMGGEFERINNTPQQGLVRFAVEPIAPAKVAPTLRGADFVPTVASFATGTARVAFQANSDRDDLSLTYKLIRNNDVANPVYTTTVNSTYWNRPNIGFTDTGLTPGATYNYRIHATDSDGNTSIGNPVSVTVASSGTISAYAQKVLDDGAGTFWRLGEASGSTAFDWAGYSDATVGAGVTRGASGAITGDTNNASTFNGSDTGVLSTPAAISSPNTFTLEAWVKTTSTQGGKIIGFGNTASGASSSYDRHVYMDNAGKIFFGVYPGAVRTVNSTTSYNDGQWHHVVATLGSNGMSLYVDDKSAGQRGDVTSGQDFAGYWRVGGDSLGSWTSQPASNYLSGVIDDVAIYPTVLTRQKIDAHWVASGRTSTIPVAPSDQYGAAVFNDNPDLFYRMGDTGGTLADAGPAASPGTYYGGVVKSRAGVVDGAGKTAVSFDGSSGFASSGKLFSNPTVYSIETWFKTSTGAGGKLVGFGNNATGLSSGYDRHVYMQDDGKLVFGTYTGVTNTAISPQSYNDNQWHQVVATQSNLGMKLYVDGALVATNAQTGAQQYDGYWKIGGDNTWGSSSPYFAGTIDDTSIYGTALTPERISTHYTLGANVAPPNQPPTAAFSATVSNLKVDLNGSTSADTDGTIASYAWNFGDSGTASGATVSHTYLNPGTYTVTLTVTDDDGATDVETKSVTVAAPPPANIAPTAAFTSTVSNLKVDLNGSPSTDTDGTIASYAWNFGDSGTASGATASHTYLNAGTYTVTLTVTDDDGATDVESKQITVTAPPTAAIATDTFTRTAATGLGTADVGGAWTLTGGSTLFAVSGGTGKVKTNTAGATTGAFLNSVSATNVDIKLTASLDKVATGGGTFTSVVGRRIGTSDYRAKVKWAAGGQVSLSLTRVVSGAETTLSAVTVAGLTAGANESLTVRLQLTGSGTTRLNGKVWKTAAAEPAAWQTTATDTTAALQAPGGVGLVSYLSGSSTNAPVVTAVDNLSVVTATP